MCHYHHLCHFHHHTTTTTSTIRTGNYTIYGVTLPDDASAQLKIITVFTNLLEPFPAEITQLENQFIRLKNSHYFYSPYRTDSQKTTIKLSSSSVQSFTKLSPFSTKGSNIQFGPYENINPFTVSYNYIMHRRRSAFDDIAHLSFSDATYPLHPFITFHRYLILVCTI